MVRPGGQPGSTAAMTSAEHLTSAEGGLVVVHEGQGFSLWSMPKVARGTILSIETEPITASKENR